MTSHLLFQSVRKKFGLFVQFSWIRFSKLYLTCPNDHSEENIFFQWKSFFPYFERNLFGSLKNSFWRCSQNWILIVHRNISSLLCFVRRIDNEHFFRKLSGKLSALWTKNFCRAAKSAFYQYDWTFWDKRFFHVKYYYYELRAWNFRTFEKKFRRGCQNKFLSPQGKHSGRTFSIEEKLLCNLWTFKQRLLAVSSQLESMCPEEHFE